MLQYSMFVMSSNSTQVSLDAAQVEERIDVIDLPPHYPLLMIHRVHHLVLLHVPSVPGVIPAANQRPHQLTSKQNADNKAFTVPKNSKRRTTNSINLLRTDTFLNHRTSPEAQSKLESKQMSKTVSKNLIENFENLSHTELYILHCSSTLPASLNQGSPDTTAQKHKPRGPNPSLAKTTQEPHVTYTMATLTDSSAI
jgi:hypothetical protein